nr:RNA polymerase sigma factor [Bacteroides sp.]
MALSKIDELALIARCLAMDDRRAFGRLVEATQEPLRRFLLNLTGGDASLTDDLAQEAYLKAWKGLRGFKATSRFRTWVTSIAMHEYFSWLRAEHPAADYDSLPDSALGAQDTASQIDAGHDVGVALASLAPLDRSLVLLRYIEDLPLGKIARMTGLTEGNVKIRLHRAKARMAQTLEQA